MSDAVRQLSALVTAGLPVQKARQIVEPQLAAMPARQLRQVELIFDVCVQSGGPIAVSLDRLANVLTHQAKNQQQAQVAFAAPRATAKLVMALPPLALLAAQLLGMNAFRAIFTTPIAFAAVVVGGALLYGGRLWSNSMLLRATPTHNDAGAFLDAVAVALSAGLNVQQSVHIATQSFELHFETVDEVSIAELQKVVDLSAQSGAAIAPLLLATADRLREIQNNATANLLAKLSVRLMIPLGVAVLPAFVLMSIVPIAVSLLTNQ